METKINKLPSAKVQEQKRLIKEFLEKNNRKLKKLQEAEKTKIKKQKEKLMKSFTKTIKKSISKEDLTHILNRKIGEMIVEKSEGELTIRIPIGEPIAQFLTENTENTED